MTFHFQRVYKNVKIEQTEWRVPHSGLKWASSARNKGDVMETNEKSMDRRARMDMDAEVAALVGGADLEKIVEKAICAQVFGLLREAGADERRRYKALAELQKFAKLLE